MKLRVLTSIFFLSIVLSLNAQDNRTAQDNKYCQNHKYSEPVTNLKNIPQELIDVDGKTVYVEAFDKEEYEHHDPSNIIEYNGLDYMWYTEHPKDTPGWGYPSYIYYATSKDGIIWEEKGKAIEPSKEKGKIDDKVTITAYVGPHDGKFYLFYSAYGSPSKYKGITYAVADTPDGPWKKSYKKYRKNPVFPGHAFTTWVHREGVGAFGFQTSWSKDGFHFKTASSYAPGTIGVYCPENFGNGKNPNGIQWGLVVMKPKGKSRYLKRIEFPLGIKEND